MFINVLGFFDSLMHVKGRQKLPEPLLHTSVVILSMVNLSPGADISALVARDLLDNILKLNPFH